VKRTLPEQPSHRILYAGDDDVDRAGVYLSTILYAEGYALDYVPSTERFPALPFGAYDLFILSDYPRRQLAPEQLSALKDVVTAGASLLMIGGWESFAGLGREYCGTPLESVLPTTIPAVDDRRNFAQGCLVTPHAGSPWAQAMPWERPPIIGGFNELHPKLGAKLHLVGRGLEIQSAPFAATLSHQSYPLLLSMNMGNGFSAALAFDLAPHWIGGMVDWGAERVRLEWEDRFIEVGSLYRQFVRSLILFCISKGQRLT